MGPDGQAVDKNEQLRYDAIDGKVPEVENLLKEGADCNQGNIHGNTALHLATLNGHTQVVKILLAHKANLNTTNKNGQTALMLAAIKGKMDIVQMLTKAGAGLDVQTQYSGMSALHLASKEGHAEICQYLLDSGAEEYATDVIGKFPEVYAANFPTEEVFRKRKKVSGDNNGNKPVVNNVKTPVINAPAPTVATSSAAKVDNDKGSANVRSEKPKDKPAEVKQDNKAVAPKVENSSTTDKPAETKNDNKAVAPKVENISTTDKPAETKHDNKPVAPKVSDNSTNEERPAASQPPSREKETDKTSYKPPEVEREPQEYNKEDKDHGPIQDQKFVPNVKGGKKSDYKKGDANWQKVKDREFEWSEEFKARQAVSVFDRLKGGGGNKGKAGDAGAKGKNTGGNDGNVPRGKAGSPGTESPTGVANSTRSTPSPDGKGAAGAASNRGSPDPGNRSPRQPVRGNRDRSPTKNKGPGELQRDSPDYSKTDKERGPIQDQKFVPKDKDPKKFNYKKGEGNWQKVKDHDFEWSDEFKARQTVSVFDRLLGGKKK